MAVETSPAVPVSLGFTPGDSIVVTGAASGIGRAVAVQAAEVGLRVAAWDLSEERLVDTVQVIRAAGGDVLAVVADVTDSNQVSAGFSRTSDLGPIRYLVNNAGPASTTELDFPEAIVSAAGSMHAMTAAWLASPPPSGASVVNVASVAGNHVGTASDWYSAAKAAIAGYTRHLAAHRADVVRANAVAPGMVDTPRLQGFAASEIGQRVLQRVPFRRMADPDEVAWVILFLLSPLASYVNGVVLPVDGGWTVTQ